MKPYRPHDIRTLSFMRSCKQAYTEMINYIYSQPTFIFGDYDSFLTFCASILQSGFQSVRSIRFDQNYLPCYSKPRPPAYPTTESYSPLRQLTAGTRNGTKYQHCSRHLQRMRGNILVRSTRACKASKPSDSMHLLRSKIYMGILVEAASSGQNYRLFRRRRISANGS